MTAEEYNLAHASFAEFLGNFIIERAKMEAATRAVGADPVSIAVTYTASVLAGMIGVASVEGKELQVLDTIVEDVKGRLMRRELTKADVQTGVQ